MDHGDDLTPTFDLEQALAGLNARHRAAVARGVTGGEGLLEVDEPAELTDEERAEARAAHLAELVERVGRPDMAEEERAALLNALEDEELAATEAEFTEVLRDLRAQRPSVETVACMTQAREAIDVLGAVAAARLSTYAELEAQAAAIADPVLAADDPDAPEGDEPAATTTEPAAATDPETPEEGDEPAEPVTEPEPTATTAATRPVPTPTPLEAIGSRLPARHAPRPAAVPAAPGETRIGRMVALDLPTARNGEEFSSFEAAREHVRRAHDVIAAGGARDGGAQMVLSLRVEYPEDRHLVAGNERQATAVVASAMRTADRGSYEAGEPFERGSLTSLTASGGLCAPVGVYYEQQHLGDNQRPVRGSLPGFAADRGGVRFVPPVAMSSILANQAGAAITTLTMAQDALSVAKTKQTVTCAGITEVDVTAQAARLGFGNVLSRTFPERVDNILQVTLDQIARIAERRLLTRMGQLASWSAQTPQVFDGFRDFVHAVASAANAIRNRNRMNPTAQLHVWAPYWLLEAATVSLAQGQFLDDNLYAVTQAQVEAAIRRFNVAVTWYRDGETAAGGLTAGQDFATQPGLGAGLLDFPHQAVWYIAPEGSYLYLDGGEINIGLVRDSVLNNTNDYEIMYEFFEDVAMVGVEAGRVVSNVCFDGAGQVGIDKSSKCATVGWGS